MLTAPDEHAIHHSERERERDRERETETETDRDRESYKARKELITSKFISAWFNRISTERKVHSIVFRFHAQNADVNL